MVDVTKKICLAVNKRTTIWRCYLRIVYAIYRYKKDQNIARD